MTFHDVTNQSPGNNLPPSRKEDIPKKIQVKVGSRWFEGKAVELIPAKRKSSQDELPPEVIAKLDRICEWANKNYPCWNEELIVEMSAKGLFNAELIKCRYYAR